MKRFLSAVLIFFILILGSFNLLRPVPKTLAESLISVNIEASQENSSSASDFISNDVASPSATPNATIEATLTPTPTASSTATPKLIAQGPHFSCSLNYKSVKFSNFQIFIPFVTCVHTG